MTRGQREYLAARRAADAATARSAALFVAAVLPGDSVVYRWGKHLIHSTVKMHGHGETLLVVGWTGRERWIGAHLLDFVLRAEGAA